MMHLLIPAESIDPAACSADNFLMTLQQFIDVHPPHVAAMQPVPEELLETYSALLPAGFLELWREYGLGFYGEWQLALINPRDWQPVLDELILPARENVSRIPIAVTALGKILFYRKLSEVDEDVCLFDPGSGRVENLAWSLEKCFNQVLCDPPSIKRILSVDLETSARQQSGNLFCGEIYEVDQTLFSTRLLSCRKVNALQRHRRFSEDAARPVSERTQQTPLWEAIPETALAGFAQMAAGQGFTEFYLSVSSDWCRLLALNADGRYNLAFWRVSQTAYDNSKVRVYSGTYETSSDAHGDMMVLLDIVLGEQSLGSDSNDERLLVLRKGATMFLLQAAKLYDIAQSLQQGELGRSDSYFQRCTMTDTFEHDALGRLAPPSFNELPWAIQQLLTVAPVQVPIAHVGQSDD